MQVFNQIIKDICSLLEIEVPQIVYSDEHLDTPTQLATVDMTNKVIYIRPNINKSHDAVFAIAHELRHLWQGVPKDHKSNAEASLEEYNNQLHEIDANAFAVLIMINFFGVRPLFEKLSDELVKKIYERAAEIAIEL